MHRDWILTVKELTLRTGSAARISRTKLAVRVQKPVALSKPLKYEYLRRLGCWFAGCSFVAVLMAKMAHASLLSCFGIFSMTCRNKSSTSPGRTLNLSVR